MALVVIALMCLAEVVTEWRAKAALACLRSSAPLFAHVVRGGSSAAVKVLRPELVPGDCIRLRAGDDVPADCRLLSSTQLEVVEAALTGESTPVHKGVGGPLPLQTPLAERSTMAFAGSVVTRGTALALVTATGQSTELRRVHAAVQATVGREKRTPLQTMLRYKAQKLTYVALGASLVGALLGLVQRKPWQEIVLIGLSLAFATIPEELPMLIAAVLAVGAAALGRSSIFVKRLRAVESLAYVDTLVTDKTGTLTRNRMMLAHALAVGRDGEFACIPVGDLATCRDSLLTAWALSVDDTSGSADPFQAAVSAALGGARTDETLGRGVLVREFPFDQTRKLAGRLVDVEASGAAAQLLAQVRGADSGPCQLVIVMGAPEAVMARCSSPVAPALRERVERDAARGLRLVAYAAAACPVSKDAGGGSEDVPLPSEPHAVLLGVLAFEDPLRPEVHAAVATARGAGVRVIMMTGDHPLAASCIARAAGIADAGEAAPPAVHCAEAEHCAEAAAAAVSSTTEQGDGSTAICLPYANEPRAWCTAALAAGTTVFARATPTHKLQLVRALQASGCVVMATGDGVNDAPALAAADVGLAVEGAADVARDAAAIAVVRSDFTAIILCLSEGRKLHDNLKHALAFYLGAKLGLVALLIVGTLWPGFPLAPVQVIVLELFMDVGASTSFVAEPAERDIMARPPADGRAPFFDGIMRARIVGGGVSMLACVLGGMAYGVYAPPAAGGDYSLGPASDSDSRARSLAFVCWLIGHVLLAWNQRTAVAPVSWSKPLWPTLPFAQWMGAVVLVALIVGLVPEMTLLLDFPRLGAADWGAAVGICFVSTFWMEAAKVLLACRGAMRA